MVKYKQKTRRKDTIINGYESGSYEDDQYAPNAAEVLNGRSWGSKKTGMRSSRRFAVVFGLGVLVALGVGIAVGVALPSGGATADDMQSGKEVGSYSLSDDQLGSVLAVYQYDGTRHEVTARKALLYSYGFLERGNQGGSYVTPSASRVNACVLQEVLASEARSKGMTVSDEDMVAYLKTNLAVSDIGGAAGLLGVSADEAKAYLEEEVLVRQLRSEIFAESGEQAAVVEPPEESGDVVAYGAYVIGLLGDEWDAATSDWARQDGPFYSVMGGEEFDGERATYEQALQAYSVASAQAQAASIGEGSAWGAYTEKVRSRVSVAFPRLLV